TGKPPFSGDSQVDSRRRAAEADLADAFARLGASNAEAELIALARKCLAPDKQQRPRDGGVVAEDLAAYQAGGREGLHQAAIDRAQAQARAAEEQRRREAEQAKTAAERKRRQVTMMLAAVAAVFMLAIAGAAIWYYQDRAARADEDKVRVQQDA